MVQLLPMALAREELLQIRDRLGQRPLRDVSIEELARAAGLSRMTLHRRGIGREEVRAGLADLLASEYREAAFPVLTSRRSAPERLAAALIAICEVDERYLGLHDDLGERSAEIFHEPGEGEVLTRGPFTDALRRILEDGARDGTLDPGPDPEETATLLFNAVGWTYRHMRVGHRWPVDRARTRLVEVLTRGVAA